MTTDIRIWVTGLSETCRHCSRPQSRGADSMCAAKGNAFFIPLAPQENDSVLNFKPLSSKEKAVLCYFFLLGSNLAVRKKVGGQEPSMTHRSGNQGFTPKHDCSFLKPCNRETRRNKMQRSVRRRAVWEDLFKLDVPNAFKFE